MPPKKINPPSEFDPPMSQAERLNAYYRQMNKRYIGKKYAYLTVIDVCEKIKNVLCQCQCGKKVEVNVGQLLGGKRKTCGSKKCRSKFSRVDHRGQVHGDLTIIKQKKANGRHTVWTCRCACGNLVDVQWVKIRRRQVINCGCKPRPGIKRFAKMNGAVGRSTSPIARAWYISCRKNKNVCIQWRDDFEVFESWAKQNGYDETSDQYSKIYLRKYISEMGYNPANCYLDFIYKESDENVCSESKTDCTEDQPARES